MTYDYILLQIHLQCKDYQNWLRFATINRILPPAFDGPHCALWLSV